MCGRYACAVKDMGGWASVFKVWLEDFENYNIAPSAEVPVFCDGGWAMMRWGLIPPWAKEARLKAATFNARGETLGEKPVFRGAWKAGKRCLVPMNGYFEWKIDKQGKRPFYITHKNREILVAGGLWEVWEDEKRSLFSCTIITREAEGELRGLHKRMPLLLDPDDAPEWLEGEVSTAQKILENAKNPEVRFYEVDPKVGNSRCKDSDVVLPL